MKKAGQLTTRKHRNAHDPARLVRAVKKAGQLTRENTARPTTPPGRAPEGSRAGKSAGMRRYLDLGRKSCDNFGMDVPGRVQDGVVVLDGSASLPEGAAVRVTLRAEPVIRVAKNQKRVEFPLVRSSAPGSVHLTNEIIADILDAEDASS